MLYNLNITGMMTTPNKRIYELERRVGNLEEALHFWIDDFKQKLDIKTVQALLPFQGVRFPGISVGNS
jgi:hypothetical protein